MWTACHSARARAHCKQIVRTRSGVIQKYLSNKQQHMWAGEKERGERVEREVQHIQQCAVAQTPTTKFSSSRTHSLPNACREREREREGGSGNKRAQRRRRTRFLFSPGLCFEEHAVASVLARVLHALLVCPSSALIGRQWRTSWSISACARGRKE